MIEAGRSGYSVGTVVNKVAKGDNWGYLDITLGGIQGFSAFNAAKNLKYRPEVAFTGARELQYWDFDKADEAYDLIRSSDDISTIAESTGMKDFQIKRIKDHLFHNKHQLDDGVRLFDSDPDIVNAWNRIQNGSHTPKDIQLLKHELFEEKFEGIFKTNYRQAHDAANKAGFKSGIE